MVLDSFLWLTMSFSAVQKTMWEEGNGPAQLCTLFQEQQPSGVHLLSIY